MPATAKQPGSEKQFWAMAHNLTQLTEHERITRISGGFEAVWLHALKSAFNLTVPAIAVLLNASISTVDRRIKSKALLNPVASERMDRIAQVAVLAESVFEDAEKAGAWMGAANDALGGNKPLLMCETELGARQVRRVLHAIEWGGVA